MQKCQNSIRKRAAANPDDRNTQIMLVFFVPAGDLFPIRNTVFFANLFFFPPFEFVGKRSCEQTRDLTQKKKRRVAFLRKKERGMVDRPKIESLVLRWNIAASVMDRLLKRLVFELAYLCSPYFADFLREHDLSYSGFARRKIAKI